MPQKVIHFKNLCLFRNFVDKKKKKQQETRKKELMKTQYFMQMKNIKQEYYNNEINIKVELDLQEILQNNLHT
jgi:hypothetical protein